MAKKNFYAVAVGRNVGIYETWQDCQQNIKGFPNAKYKGFTKLDYAVNWYKENGGDMSALPKEYGGSFADTAAKPEPSSQIDELKSLKEQLIAKWKEEIAEAEAALAAAKLRAEKAEDELDEAEAGVEKAEDELDEAEAGVEKAEDKLAEAEAGVEKAEDELDEAEARVEKAEDKLDEAEARVEKAEDKLDEAQEGVHKAYDELISRLMSIPEDYINDFEVYDEWISQLMSILESRSAESKLRVEKSELRVEKSRLRVEKSKLRAEKSKAELAELKARIEPAKNFDVETTTQSNVTDDFKIFRDKYGFQHLNAAQIDAVQTVNGKSLLFAVPGSGKTTVLTARAGYLLYGQKDFHITADMLMNLTFTRAAAREMSARFKKIFNASNAPDFSTIHSFCIRKIIPELKQKNFPIPPNVINSDVQENFRVKHSDTDDEINFLTPSANRITSYEIFKKVFNRFKLPYRDDTLREKISSVITSIKNRQMPRAEYEKKVITINQHRHNVAKIFDAYQEELAKNNCMDFDDMLIYSLQGLKLYPDVLEKIRGRYFYWSIDEAQDNSKLQNDLILLLAGDGNLFMVGDDDQSIYNFRGSEPKLLLDYGALADVKNMVTVTNYRSGKVIINTTKNFIENNKRRALKEMQPRSDAPGGRINFFTRLLTERHQYHHIVKRAANCIRNGKSLAVIYRLNASSFPVMFWLKKFGIPFNVKKDFSEIAFGKVFSDVISLMKFATDPSDFDAYKSCRYLLKISLTNENIKTAEQLIKNNSRIENILDWAAEVQENLKGFVERAKIILEEIKKLSPLDAVKYIVENFIGFEPSAVSRLRNYAVLAAAEPYETIEEFLTAQAELIEDARREKSDALVTLTSMHSAKGLEFDNVIIIDSWEQIMNKPFLQDADEFGCNDDEEERRLFYVAATRAKNTLDICVVKKYFGCTEEPSTFVTELAQSYETATGKSVIELPLRPDIKPITKFKLATYENQPQLNFQKLSTILQSVQAVSFMRSIDLPDEFNCAVLDWFKVSSLNELQGRRLLNLKAQEISYTDSQETIYHGRVDNYILVYMLVNFYKIWAPLWDLLKKDKLTTSLKVLELGAGPGTSMISLIYFYQLLSIDNPDVQFKISYDVIEREEDFIKACQSLATNFEKHSQMQLLKNNYNLKVKCRFATEDIYSFAETSPEKDYDLILESNVLNGNENLRQDKTDNLILALADKLADKGALILIEPGKNINVDELKRIGYLLFRHKKFFCRVEPRKTKVLVDKMTLVKSVKELGLRNDKRDEHWFSYTVFGKGD